MSEIKKKRKTAEIVAATAGGYAADSSRLKKTVRVIPVISVMGIIFYLSSQPGDTIDLPDITDIDKLLHSLVYGVLALTAAFGVPKQYLKKHPVRTAVLVVLFCLLYGISDEFHQSFVPNRTPSLLDLAADTLGSVVAMTGLYAARKWRGKGDVR